MYQGSPEQHRSLVSTITRSAGRPPKALRHLDWRGFLRAYFANVDAKDLADRDPEELAGAAFSHLEFALRRRRTALVRVFNPTLREHGFVSPHTIIDVVNDDMPFLVDSINLALTERALTLHFLAHPIFAVSRAVTGTLRALHRRAEPSAGAKQRLESFQHLEVDRIVDPAALKSLGAEIERSMRDVRVACADWGPMQTAARSAAADLSALSARFDPTELSETCALLEWMENRHFTFLGYREYRLRGRKGREVLEPIKATGLGILRPRHKPPENTNRTLPADIRRESRSRSLSLVTKSNLLSTVHRSGYLDYVGIKNFDAKGVLIGERRFLGLWTSAAYNSNPRDIPMLRQKVAQVAQHFSLAPDSHDGKALQHILETFPRDELFQASVAELNRIATGIFGLQDRPRVRVLSAPRPISPVLFLPGVRAARKIQHSGPPAHRAGDTRGVFRGEHGIPGTDRRIEPGAHPYRGPHRAERRDSRGRRRAGTARRRRRALVAGRLQGCAAAAFRRSLRAAAVRQICAGISRRLHGGFPGRRRRSRCVFPRGGGEGACAPAPGHLSDRTRAAKKKSF